MTPTLPALEVDTREDLAALLGMPLSKLNLWLYAISEDARYVAFELQRAGNRPPRIIEAPIKPIKDIQRRFLALIAPYYRPHRGVHGYVAERSIVTNARIHQDRRWVLRVDLADFFPSINFGRVRGLFLKPPFNFPPAVATLAAQICCHRNHVPQGAPTSPLISNIICRRLDRQLGELASAQRCSYSRYCDDLVFSTRRRDFPAALAIRDTQTNAMVVGTLLRDVIQSNGFQINESKTRLRSYSQRQVVTGLVANRRVNVPREFVRSLRMVLHIWKRHGEAAAAASLYRYRPKRRPPGKTLPELRMVVRGKVQYVGAVKGWSSSVYLSLARRLHDVDPSFRRTERTAPTQEVTTQATEPLAILRFFGEGKTDHAHIAAALRHFQALGRFKSLRLLHETTVEGDAAVLEVCKAAAKLVHDTPPLVFMFDDDNAGIAPKVKEVGKAFKAWGNKVYSFVVPVPSHRAGEARLCIEMLYSDDVLSLRDANGRRLYLRSEFRPNGLHKTEPAVYCNAILKKELVCEGDVVDGASGKTLSLSKQGFADAIATKTLPFDNVSFDGFATVFEILELIAADARANSTPTA